MPLSTTSRRVSPCPMERCCTSSISSRVLCKVVQTAAFAKLLLWSPSGSRFQTRSLDSARRPPILEASASPSFTMSKTLQKVLWSGSAAQLREAVYPGVSFSTPSSFWWCFWRMLRRCWRCLSQCQGLWQAFGYFPGCSEVRGSPSPGTQVQAHSGVLIRQ